MIFIAIGLVLICAAYYRWRWLADPSLDWYPFYSQALAHLLMGALHEASLLMAYSEDRATTRSEVNETIDRLFTGIRQSPS